VKDILETTVQVCRLRQHPKAVGLSKSVMVMQL